MLVGGILLVVLALLIKGTVANPLALLHTWGALDTMPPLWLVNLLWFGGYFVVGGGWFGVLCMPPCGGSREVLRYKGSMFLVLAVFFSFEIMLMSSCFLIRLIPRQRSESSKIRVSADFIP